jgi:Fur family ferric uptake transcriptional regulator
VFNEGLAPGEVDLKNSTQETFQNYLTESGLKCTVQRNIILDAFLLVDRHVRVDDLCLILRAKHRNMGHATVYRTLKLFVEAGIARELQLGDGFTRYEPVMEGKQHDHLVCNVCNSITEFKTGAIEQLKDEIARSQGFQVETLKLELRGVCKQCLAQHPERQ